MIKIKRGDCPEVLADTPQKGAHYNKKAVVEALHEMQKEKCCYCEQFIPAEGHIKAVEHFHPKSVYKHMKNDWENLLLVCAQCNGKKSDIFPVRLSVKDGDIESVVYKNKKAEGAVLLIDPSDESCDPEDYIDFVVDDSKDDDIWGLPFAKDDCERGRLSIEVIGLDGSYYLRKRQTVLENIRFLCINLYDGKKNERIDQFNTAKGRIEFLLSSKSEYSACARAFARLKRLDEKYGVRIPKGYE